MGSKDAVLWNNTEVAMFIFLIIVFTSMIVWFVMSTLTVPNEEYIMVAEHIANTECPLKQYEQVFEELDTGLIVNETSGDIQLNNPCPINTEMEIIGAWNAILYRVRCLVYKNYSTGRYLPDEEVAECLGGDTYQELDCSLCLPDTEWEVTYKGNYVGTLNVGNDVISQKQYHDSVWLLFNNTETMPDCCKLVIKYEKAELFEIEELINNG